VTSYSRQDVLRILQITSRQLLGWERAELIPPQQSYSFQDLGQLRTLRILRQEAVSAASIRHSIVAMKAVAGMTNPLIEATLIRTGSRLAFRHDGDLVDPIRRQFLIDFERLDQRAPTGPDDRHLAAPEPYPLRRRDVNSQNDAQALFLEAVEAEEAGQKIRAIQLYQQIAELDPNFAPAYINLGTIHFHLHEYAWAEQLYRRATEIDPTYVLAFFDLGNVLDELQRPNESITAYGQAVALAPNYADAHYNLALAYERKGEWRSALKHWQAYIRLDTNGPWAEHAHSQIRSLLSREKLSIAWRAHSFIPPSKGMAALELVSA